MWNDVAHGFARIGALAARWVDSLPRWLIYKKDWDALRAARSASGSAGAVEGDT